MLDGMWKLKTDPDRVGMEEEWFRKMPDSCRDTCVPSCWNNDLGLYEYEGQAWYFTKFTTDGSGIHLIFHAVTGLAEVYLDGVHLGSHYGGWTKFSFVLETLAAGEHFLAVTVDNTHDSMSTIPLAKVDWYHYGGIHRNVEVQEIGSLWIQEARIEYRLTEGLDAAEIQAALRITGKAEGVKNPVVTVYGEDRVLFAREIGQGPFPMELKLEGALLEQVKLWDVFSPNLYYFRIEISDGEAVLDDQVERTGFRQIRTENKKILLNEKEVYFKGVNRHEDHPDWGFSLPLKLMKRDIDIIKNLGCNAIRGSHYPNTELFLDYLDQEGLLFWEEIPIWGYEEEVLKNPLIRERGLKMLEEMVTRDYHHPCILFWGVHNEVASHTEAAVALTRDFIGKVKSLDTTRLVSYASNRPLRDCCYSLSDVISINAYHGWYMNELSRWDSFLEDLKAYAESLGLGHLPILMTEFGAGAMTGVSTFENQKWSENYQEMLMGYVLELFHKTPGIAGSFIWQYCDIRTAREVVLQRPRGFNNKGIVTEYRNPKLAYWKVQKIYNSI